RLEIHFNSNGSYTFHSDLRFAALQGTLLYTYPNLSSNQTREDMKCVILLTILFIFACSFRVTESKPEPRAPEMEDETDLCSFNSCAFDDDCCSGTCYWRRGFICYDM
ncbi:Conotoxin ArMKLT2-01, partial [Orchesella cincta]